MKILVLLLGLGLLSTVASAQEHAPTKDVCQADVAAWYSQKISIDYNHAESARIADNVKNTTATAKLPIHEVLARAQEMRTCADVDKSTNLYSDAEQFYHDVFVDRAFSFIRRHHLMEKLNQEDAAGAR